MASLTCDLFPMLHADGPTQMAADEVLLEHAIAAGRPALRFYTWDPATLSLGYFQAYADRLTTLPVVRRPTGGGAIVHHHELTYGLALPPGPAQKGKNWTCRMHDVIRDALGAFGVAAASGCGQEIGRGAFLCFEHQTPGDVLLGNHKVVGSAQRRRAGGLLQHGSILLAASPFAPQRLGIREIVNIEIAVDRLAEAIARAFSQETDWARVPAAWSAGQLARREQIVAERYRQAPWTERR